MLRSRLCRPQLYAPPHHDQHVLRSPSINALVRECPTPHIFFSRAFLVIMVKSTFSSLLLSLVLASVHLVNAQNEPPESSWPHAYPGMPTGDLSPEWQNCESILRFLACDQHLMEYSLRRLPSDRTDHKRHLGSGS